MIVAVRIDGRLIHGQVANLWTAHLSINRIMVVDDEVVHNELEKSGLKLATPGEVKLSVLSIEKAANHILAGKYDSQRLLIVVRRPNQLLRLIDLGVRIQEVNIGNMAKNEHTRLVTRSVHVTKKDENIFKELNAKGVHLIAQMVPNDKAEDFMSLLTK